MAILFSLLLLALGILGADTFIEEKLPASRDYLIKLKRYEEWVGIAGLVMGIISILLWLAVLSHYGSNLANIVLGLFAALLMIGLGVIFGIDYIRKSIANPDSIVVQKIEVFRAKLLPYKQPMGIAAIVVAVLHVLM